jgi:hypothetical protein
MVSICFFFLLPSLVSSSPILRKDKKGKGKLLSEPLENLAPEGLLAFQLVQQSGENLNLDSSYRSRDSQMNSYFEKEEEALTDNEEEIPIDRLSHNSWGFKIGKRDDQFGISAGESENLVTKIRKKFKRAGSKKRKKSSTEEVLNHSLKPTQSQPPPKLPTPTSPPLNEPLLLARSL